MFKSFKRGMKFLFYLFHQTFDSTQKMVLHAIPGNDDNFIIE